MTEKSAEKIKTFNVEMKNPQLTLTDPQLTLTDPQLTLTDPQLTLTDPQLTLTDPQLTLTDRFRFELIVATIITTCELCSKYICSFIIMQLRWANHVDLWK